MSDQYTMQDPKTQYPLPTFPLQSQPVPGLAKDMRPKPDHGEETYRGTGRLLGRKALITGADSGIGRAVAIAFAREGADVVLAYLPSEDADAREVVQLVDRAVKELGGLDLVVNVAGKQHAVAEIADVTSDQFDQTFKTNVYAMFWITKAALPHIPAGGSIINTSSVQAYSPSATLVDYAATKAAINTFSKALAQQVASKGIRVNVVAPGPVWTPLQISGGQPGEKIPDFGTTSPLGRPGQPAEVAPAYVFLASAESSFISGETLSVNGGMPTP